MSAATTDTAPRRLTESELRELEHFGTLANQLEKWVAVTNQLEKWVAVTRASFVRAWLSDAHEGYRNDARGYTLTERRLGVAVVTLDDGSTRVIQAPVPFA